MKIIKKILIGVTTLSITLSPILAHAQIYLGISLGLGSNASGNNAIAAGQSSVASGTGSIALGTTSNATGNASVALGNNSIANASAAVALGASSTAALNSTALGTQASATGTNSVALGNLTVVTRDNTVGIGNRTLSQVSNGVLATDAVNLGQLNAVSGLVATQTANLANLSAVATVYDDTTKANLTLGGIGAAAPVNLHNVGAGISATDAVNLGQLNAVSGLVATQSANLANLNAVATVYDDTTKANLTLGGVGAAPVNLHNVGAGISATDAVNVSQLNTVGNQVAIQSANLANLSAVATVYDDTTKANLTLGGVGAIAPVNLHNVGAGISATDAVNVSQLNGVSTNLNNLTTEVGALDLSNLKYDNTAHTGITLGGAGATVAVGVHNVANAVVNTDAVNLGQLTNTVANATNNLLSYDDAAKANITLGGLGAATTVNLHNVGNGLVATDAVNLGQLDDINASLNTSLANVNAHVALLDSTSVQYDDAIKTSVTLGGVGSTTPVALHNIATGVMPTDAVNVAQLDTGLASVTSSGLAYDDPTHTSLTLGGVGAVNPVSLKNVAAGINATDATNVGQLNAVNNNLSVSIAATNNNMVTLDASNLKYDDALKNSVTLGGIGSTTPVALHNIATGVTPTDAVNVAQLDTGLASVTSSGLAYDDPTHTSVSLGGVGAVNPVSLKNVAAGINATDATNVGQLNAVNNNLSASIAATNNNMVTLDASNLKYDGVFKNSITLGGVGSTTPVALHNVAQATLGTDAVNLNQLNSDLANVTNSGINYDDASHTSLTLGGVGATTPVTVKNVAAGVTATDAVNVGQLNSVNNNLSASIAASNNQIATLDTIALKYDDALKTSATLGGVGSTTPVALHNVAQGTAGTDAVNVNQLNSGLANVENNGISYDNATHTTVTLGGANATTPVTIKNVAAGVNTTDAVNVGQLSNVSSQMMTMDSSNVKFDDASKTSVTLGGAGSTTPVALHNVADATQANDAVNLKQLSSLLTANPSTPLAVQYDDLTRSSISLGGSGATNTVVIHNVGTGVAANDAVNVSQLDNAMNSTIATSKTYTDTQVSTVKATSGTGTNGGGTTTPVNVPQIIDAANGYTDKSVKDAMTQANSYTDTTTQAALTQATAYTDNALAQANSYTDQKFSQVNDRINKLDDRINGVGATTAAMSSLVYNPLGGKNYVSGAVSNFRNAQGVAFGYFRRTENDKIVVNVKFGAATKGGSVAVAAGMGYSW